MNNPRTIRYYRWSPEQLAHIAKFADQNKFPTEDQFADLLNTLNTMNTLTTARSLASKVDHYLRHVASKFDKNTGVPCNEFMAIPTDVWREFNRVFLTMLGEYGGGGQSVEDFLRQFHAATNNRPKPAPKTTVTPAKIEATPSMTLYEGFHFDMYAAPIRFFEDLVGIETLVKREGPCVAKKFTDHGLKEEENDVFLARQAATFQYMIENYDAVMAARSPKDGIKGVYLPGEPDLNNAMKARWIRPWTDALVGCENAIMDREWAAATLVYRANPTDMKIVVERLRKMAEIEKAKHDKTKSPKHHWDNILGKSDEQITQWVMTNFAKKKADVRANPKAVKTPINLSEALDNLETIKADPVTAEAPRNPVSMGHTTQNTDEAPTPAPEWVAATTKQEAHLAQYAKKANFTNFPVKNGFLSFDGKNLVFVTKKVSELTHLNDCESVNAQFPAFKAAFHKAVNEHQRKAERLAAQQREAQRREAQAKYALKFAEL